MSLISGILVDATDVDKADLRAYITTRERATLKDFGGAVDGATDDSTAFQSALDSGLPLLIRGDIAIASGVTYTGDVDIFVDGFATITCTAGSTINHMLKVTGKLRIHGGFLEMDGNDKTYLAIHCPTVLPELENVIYKNTLSVAGLYGRNFGGASATDYSGTNGTGHGYMKSCRGENCGSFTLPTGSGKTSATSFQLIDCQTNNTCGDVTNVFAINDMGYGLVRGGKFTGVSGTAPNMTRTGRCEYIGGHYYDMLRGPTAGEETDNVTIIGGVSSGMSFSGVSVDARLGADNTVPYVVGVVDWTVEGAPAHGVFCQAGGLKINVRYFGDGTATSSKDVVRLTDALNVALGDISAYNAGGSVLVQLGSGAAPSPGSSAYKTGTWQSDTTSLTPIRTNSVSTLTMRPLRTVTANTDLSYLEDMVLVDASSGSVDLDVPNNTSVGCDVIGHHWDIIVIDSTNSVTITRAGGGSAINGATSFTIPAGSKFTQVRVTSIGGGNYLVTVPQAIYQSGAAAPSGAVTPAYLHQLYRDTSATPDDVYIAVGMANTDWEKITA